MFFHLCLPPLQFDFYSWMPNGPTTMKSPPPSTKGVTTMKTILETLPDVNATTSGVTVVWVLSNEPMDRVSCLEGVRSNT